jgi:uncharacterized phage protein gp47/JayE
MTPFDTPTVKNIADTIIANYESETGTTVPLVTKSVIKVLAYAFAGVVVLLWRFGSWQYLQIFIATADLPALKKWGSLVNIDYNNGDTAILTADITGATASTITTDVAYLGTNGLVYKVQAPVTVVGGNATVTIACLTTGSVGNLTNGAVITLTNPFTGVPETAIIASTVNVGSEDEDTEVYRARVTLRYRLPPQGGAAADYVIWGTEVTEVTDIYPYVIDATQVTVYVGVEGSGVDRIAAGSVSPNPFPSNIGGVEQPITGSGNIYETALAINSDGGGLQNRRPMGTSVEVLPVVAANIEVVITGVTPAPSGALQQQIKEAIQESWDLKKPEIPALGQTLNNATVFTVETATVVQNLLTSLDAGSFTSLTLEYLASIETSIILPIGAIAVESLLTINGGVVP